VNILNLVYTLRFFFSSKCSLFHNSNVFGSCIIHILYIYLTNIGTEYFKHGIYSPFFFSFQNAVCLIILTYLVPVLFTFYVFIQQICVLNILNIVYTLRFFSKCSLFHNSNIFVSCIIHILYIYSTNIGTEYFKHGIYSPFLFPFQNAVCFIILTYLVPVLLTFYIQGVLKLKKKSGAK
jgi:hypothetical protein